MKPYLLDVNVLIALAWPNHVHHSEARAWFNQKAVDRFRTCPLTQTGFVRISSNPAFASEAVTPAGALNLLRRVCALPGHEFWPDDISLPEAHSAMARLFGHRQVTDAYLVALAVSHDGILATLDRGVAAVATGRNIGCVDFIV
jgi:toxin-antitoxin system PIN domain toxin